MFAGTEPGRSDSRVSYSTKATGVAGEGMVRNQHQARFGRIYARTLVGDYGCDENSEGWKQPN